MELERDGVSVLSEQLDASSGHTHVELDSLRTRLKESQARQRGLEEEIAGLEAELADDRELLDMAAQQGGIGVAEAIRRNKRLKAALREREVEIEKCRDELSACY